MKVMISAEELERCRNVLANEFGIDGAGYVQVNYYFDTEDFAVASSHGMLRVRKKARSMKLQYKDKRKRIGVMLLCQEEEAPLTELPHSVNPARYFPGAPDRDCMLLGDCVTYRTDFMLPGAVVSLDENYYLGQTDFELEIEGEEAAIRRIAQQLAPNGEHKKGNGKFSRFLRAYRKYYAL